MSETMKLKDQIYEKVLNEITEGRYLQNEIITERELIENMESANPLSERRSLNFVMKMYW